MIYSTVLFTTLVYLANAQRSNLYIGQCTQNSDCDQNGWKEHECISVDSDRVELEDLNLCAPKATCAGTKPGNCPIFTYHPDKHYREVQPICAVFKPDNCAGVSDAENTVNCVEIQTGNTTEHVIFGCKDIDVYKKTSIFTPEYVENQLQGCINPNGDAAQLCSGAGTCGPKHATHHEEYTCRCRKGFKGQYCEESTKPVCQKDQDCHNNGSCDQRTGKCICNIGFSGNQCQLCNGNSASCSGNGKCNQKKGFCECKKDFTGKYCEMTMDKFLNTNQKSAASQVIPSFLTVLFMTLAMQMF